MNDSHSTRWRIVNAKGGIISRLDQRLSLVMILVSACMVAYGLYMLIQAQSELHSSSSASLEALQHSKISSALGEWPKGKRRILLHLNRMGGGCIAAITAVLVANVQTNPEFISWLLPSVVGTPLIIYWSKGTMK